MARTWLRWMPAVVVPALIASGAVLAPIAANAAFSLPAKSAEQVLSLMAGDSVSAFSATVTQVANLGIPALPAMGRSADSAGSAGAVTSVLSLLTGTHTARLYVAGESKMRVQVMDSLAERDLIRDGRDVWLYNSRDRTAVHAMAKSPNTAGHTRTHGLDALATGIQSPNTLAAELLRRIEPTTTVAVGSDVRVAGRTAYTLVLTPQARGSLVSRSSIAIDSATGMPLSVQVFAVGQRAAALSVALTSLTLAAPDASLFAFTPPAGTTVTEQALPARVHRSTPSTPALGDQRGIRQGEGLDDTPTAPLASGMKVSGSGWATIISIPANSANSANTANSATSSMSTLMASPLVAKLSSPVVGGRAFQTALLSVLVTTDGRIFAGSVPLDRLQAAAAIQ